jgi:chromosome partitioning protein
VKVITLLNQKGGVGKTTLAAHIAAGLSLKGKRVLAVDTDPQGSLTSLFGLPLAPSVYDMIIRNKPWQELLVQVPMELYVPEGREATPLALVQGNVETRNIGENTNRLLAFRKRFMEIANAFDYVIIDTSPTPSLLHGSILIATDYVIYPVELDLLSTEHGLVDSSTSVQEVRDIATEYNLDVAESLAVVPNKYRKSTVMHNTVLEGLRDTYGEAVWDPLTLSIVYQEAAYERRLLFNYPPAGGAIRQMESLVNRVTMEVKVG